MFLRKFTAAQKYLGSLNDLRKTKFNKRMTHFSHYFER